MFTLLITIIILTPVIVGFVLIRVFNDEQNNAYAQQRAQELEYEEILIREANEASDRFRSER